MTMKKLVWGLMGLSLLFSGCIATPEAPVDRRVSIAEEIGSDVMITDIRCTKGQGEYYTFQANAVNNTAGDYAVEWKVVWLDADGLAIDSVVSTWNKRMIGAKDIVGLTSTAPCREAVDMMFYLRRLR